VVGLFAIVPSGNCIISPAPTDELFFEYILELLLEFVEDCIPSAAIKPPPDAAMAAAEVDDVEDFFSE
jgi:hypothetical protein